LETSQEEHPWPDAIGIYGTLRYVIAFPRPAERILQAIIREVAGTYRRVDQ
jgi:hypothetical protein